MKNNIKKKIQSTELLQEEDGKLTSGPKVEEFEKYGPIGWELSIRFVNSGSSANFMHGMVKISFLMEAR